MHARIFLVHLNIMTLPGIYKLVFLVIILAIFSFAGPGRPNTKSPFAKFQQMDNKQNELSPLTRQNSLPSLNERKVSAPPPSTSNTLGGVGNR